MTYDDQQRAFLESHTLGILATGRRDGSPQQSMVVYAVDNDGRIIISAKEYTAKWQNAVRQSKVSFTVADGRVHLVVYGTAETVADDPLRAELTADVFAVFSGGERPDPATLVETLDEQRRTVLRITPERVIFHE